MNKLTRRSFLAASAAFGAACLFPSIAIESELEPGHNLFVVGDLHLTNNDGIKKKAEMLISSLKALIGEKRGFHLLFNGDIVEFPNLAKKAENGAWQWEQFAEVAVSLKKLGFILHLNLGNHDGEVELAQDVLEGIVPGENIGNSSFGVGGTQIIQISGIHPSELDYGFLDSELSGARSKRQIVVSHYPPDKLTWNKDKFGEKVGYSLWAKKEILRRISNSEASVLSSHSHSPFWGKYASPILGREIEVVGTPSVTYTLPYLRSEIRPPKVSGITVIDLGDFVGGARFYDGKKAFRPERMRVESTKGTYAPRILRMK